MASYWVLYFYVVVTTAAASVSRGNLIYSTRHFFLTLLVIVLVIFSGFRGFKVDADSSNYLEWFQSLDIAGEHNLLFLKDPAFYIIGKVISSLGLSISYLFLTYAAIALWSKLRLIKFV